MSQEPGSHNGLELVIKTTKGAPWKNKFPKTTKIQEVIDAVVAHFGFSAEGKYELHLDSEKDDALDPSMSLDDLNIADDAVLVFTDLGVAV